MGWQEMSNDDAIRLVLADVDGTLVDGEKRLTEAAIAAARALGAAGITLAITSGRPPRGMNMLIAPLALSAPVAGFNGGVLVHPDLSVIECHALEPDVAASALKLVLDNSLDAWVYTPDQWLVRDASAPRIARETWTVKFEATVVPAFTAAHLARTVKIVGVSEDYDRVAACEKQAQAVLGAGASCARSQPYYLDITHPLANKGSVVRTLSRVLSIPIAQIATIGDMPNDILMFRESGFSIAMGNASDAVKANAGATTDSNQNDGFAKAMDRYILRRG